MKKFQLAVGRGCCWHRGVGEGCLNVDASYRRLDADSDYGFRPVRRSAAQVTGRRAVAAAEMIDTAISRVLEQYGNDFDTGLLDFATHCEFAADDALRKWRQQTAASQN